MQTPQRCAGYIAEYDALVAEAKAQVEDMSVRYNTFAQAEASIINHAVTFPTAWKEIGFKATRLKDWKRRAP